MRRNRIDYEIKSLRVKLIDEGGDAEEMDLSQAVKLAKDQQKNLVEMGVNQGVSICKIMDYKKHIYKLQKKKKIEQKKSQKMNIVKIIAFKLNIGENDLNIKLKNVRKFLLEEKQVKLVLQLMKRDMMKPESIAKGLQILQESIGGLSDISKIRIDGRKSGQRDQFVVLTRL